MNDTLSRIITGLVILIIGVGALLEGLGVISFWQHFGTWWPVLLIVAGILVLVNNVRQYIVSIALLLAGTLALLNNLNVVEVNIWSLIWPIIIIAVGLSIIVNHAAKTPKKVRTQDLETTSAIFGGNETVNKAKNYQGGKVTAVFGGVTIDLREAVIKDSATLEVFAVCGGVELRVPNNWKVKHSVFPILGGVESKAHSDDPKAPTLHITGTVALGGVEIKT